MELSLASAEETRKFGEALASLLQGGDVLTLSGPLGAGKTTLVQGLAWGLGLPRSAYAPSPTYAIALSYPTTPPLHHLDLYRLEQGADALLGDDYFADDVITVIEWPERATHWLRAAHFALTLEAIAENGRRAILQARAALLAERLGVWCTNRADLRFLA